MNCYDVPVSWVVSKILRVYAASPKCAEEIALRMWDQYEQGQVFLVDEYTDLPNQDCSVSLEQDTWVEENIPTHGSSELLWAVDSIEVDFDNIKQISRGIG